MSYATTDGGSHGSNVIPFDDNEFQPGTDEDDDEQINMFYDR
jgi:hypothetical protein